MADKDFDSDDEDREPSRRRSRKDSQKGKITPTKLALIIWGPIAAIALLGMMIFCGYAAFIVFLANSQPKERNLLIDGPEPTQQGKSR